ncbi:MAG: radical SAM/SPASM domain-containing protein [bacterium]
MATVRGRYIKYPKIERLLRDPITHLPRRHTIPRILNLLSVWISRYLKLSHIIGYPYNLLIEPTNACNLRCPLCPTGAGLMTRKVGYMDFDNYMRLIDEMAPYLYTITLANLGEPLLHPKIFEMAEYASKKNIAVYLSTNAHFIKKEDISKLINSGFEKIDISIDGATDETYKKFRRGGNFKKVIENIRMLSEERKKSGRKTPFLNFNFIIMKHNEHELEKARELVEKLGMDNLQLVAVSIPHYKLMNTEEALKYLPKNPEYSRFKIGKLGVKLRDERSEGEACIWAFTRSVVNWDGTVSPCCIDYDSIHNFGNVFKTGLKRIWNNEKYVTFRKKLTQCISIVPVCSNCSATIR